MNSFSLESLLSTLLVDNVRALVIEISPLSKNIIEPPGSPSFTIISSFLYD